ncbi:Hint-domain [Pelomyxa schiedti]|nr:Hint-domain [Pelomyxa schiedti]
MAWAERKRDHQRMLAEAQRKMPQNPWFAPNPLTASLLLDKVTEHEARLFIWGPYSLDYYVHDNDEDEDGAPGTSPGGPTTTTTTITTTHEHIITTTTRGGGHQRGGGGGGGRPHDATQHAQQEEEESVMRGFAGVEAMAAARAASRYGGLGAGGEGARLECSRIITPEGLPPYNEAEIQLVEKRIHWTRNRGCTSWARRLLSTGHSTILLDTALAHAWPEWYPREKISYMQGTPFFQLIRRCCQRQRQRMMSLLCGRHLRLGKVCPLRQLPDLVFNNIISLFTSPSHSFDDGLEREATRQDLPEEKWMQPYTYSLLPGNPLGDVIGAIGNFNPKAKMAESPIFAILSSYCVLFERGPWLKMHDFITAIEAGNVGILKCYAFYKSGAYAQTPQNRFMAIRLLHTLFGQIDSTEELSFAKCFTGEGAVSMANGETKPVRNIVVGDFVTTEAGVQRVSRIYTYNINKVIPMCCVSGVWLTPGHPILLGGEWVHPFEVTTVENKYIEELYNFELEGGPLSNEHSVIINNLTVCTLGKDCGKRIVTGWPKADEQAGTGYWRSGTSHWCKSIQQTLLCAAGL